MKNLYLPFAFLFIFICGCGDDKNSTSLADIEFRVTDITLLQGETVQAAVTYTPADASPEPVFEYISSDQSIFTVTSTGTITGITAGGANLQVTYNGISKFATVIVNPTPINYNFSFNTFVYLLHPGYGFPLNSALYTTNVHNTRISWSVSDLSVGDLEDSYVTGHRYGEFVLTATIPGNRTFDLPVRVVDENTPYVVFKETDLEMIPGQSRPVPEYVMLPSDIEPDEIHFVITGTSIDITDWTITARQQGTSLIDLTYSNTGQTFDGTLFSVNVAAAEDFVHAVLDYTPDEEGSWINTISIRNDLPLDIDQIEFRTERPDGTGTAWILLVDDISIESGSTFTLSPEEGWHEGELDHMILKFRYMNLGYELELAVD